MSCPTDGCDRKDYLTIDSRRREAGRVYRRRMCPEHKTRWTTIEILDSDYDNLIEAAKPKKPKRDPHAAMPTTRRDKIVASFIEEKFGEMAKEWFNPNTDLYTMELADVKNLIEAFAEHTTMFKYRLRKNSAVIKKIKKGEFLK